MNPIVESTIKKIVLTTTQFGVQSVVSAALATAIKKVSSKNFEEVETNNTQEETVREAIKKIGLALVITIVSAVIANAAGQMVENVFWPKNQES